MRVLNNNNKKRKQILNSTVSRNENPTGPKAQRKEAEVLPRVLSKRKDLRTCENEQAPSRDYVRHSSALLSRNPQFATGALERK